MHTSRETPHIHNKTRCGLWDVVVSSIFFFLTENTHIWHLSLKVPKMVAARINQRCWPERICKCTQKTIVTHPVMKIKRSTFGQSQSVKMHRDRHVCTHIKAQRRIHSTAIVIQMKDRQIHAIKNNKHDCRLLKTLEVKFLTPFWHLN